MGEYADLPALSEIVLARPAGYLTDGRVNGRFSAPCGRSDRISERGLCKVLCARQGVRQVRQSLVRGDTDMDDVKFAVHDETASARRPHYYGVHHLALNTDDMKMTVDFYVGVLGMRLVHAMKVPPRRRDRAGQPWQSAVRGNPSLLLRHGARRAACLLRNPQRCQAQGRSRRDRHDAACCVRSFPGDGRAAACAPH